jgi:hypothetical protein
LTLSAKDPTSGSVVSLANLLAHVGAQVTVGQADNGLSASALKRARALLRAAASARTSLRVSRVVRCRFDQQPGFVESPGVDNLAP